jgi:hypothetical protein
MILENIALTFDMWFNKRKTKFTPTKKIYFSNRMEPKFVGMKIVTNVCNSAMHAPLKLNKHKYPGPKKSSDQIFMEESRATLVGTFGLL